MKKKLIDLLGKITLNDLTPEQRAKANELLVMLKGEPRKRKSPKAKAVKTPVVATEVEESFS